MTGSLHSLSLFSISLAAALPMATSWEVGMRISEVSPNGEVLTIPQAKENRKNTNSGMAYILFMAVKFYPKEG